MEAHRPVILSCVILWRRGRFHGYRAVVPQRLPRFLAHELQARELEQKIARILIETGESLPEAYRGRPLTASADGHRDDRRRGLPLIGRGNGGGASPGTDPVRALLAKKRRRRR